MADSEKVIESLEICERDGCGFNCTRCHYETDTKRSCIENLMHDALELLKEQENAIKEIEERKAFNLKCDGKPEWLRKGIDVGLNTALDILKGKEGEQK